MTTCCLQLCLHVAIRDKLRGQTRPVGTSPDFLTPRSHPEACWDILGQPDSVLALDPASLTFILQSQGRGGRRWVDGAVLSSSDAAVCDATRVEESALSRFNEAFMSPVSFTQQLSLLQLRRRDCGPVMVTCCRASPALQGPPGGSKRLTLHRTLSVSVQTPKSDVSLHVAMLRVSVLQPHTGLSFSRHLEGQTALCGDRTVSGSTR